MPFIYTKFAGGQEPSVLTSVSDECSDGRCEDCTGIYDRDDYPGQLIFCIHACHKKPNQVM
jgi:hypothetical protein